MDPRERWKTLQAHLGTARARLEAQDRAGALEAIDAALAIDPEFLAAQSLRVRLLEERPPSADPAPAQPPACSNADLAGGLGRFEERARRRRVDHSVDRARAALAECRLTRAAAALDEIHELDPNLPELPLLEARFREAASRRRAGGRGAWLAAAAAFAALLFGASRVERARVLPSYPYFSGSVVVLSRVEPLAVGMPPRPAEAAAPAPAVARREPVRAEGPAAAARQTASRTAPPPVSSLPPVPERRAASIVRSTPAVTVPPPGATAAPEGAPEPELSATAPSGRPDPTAPAAGRAFAVPAVAEAVNLPRPPSDDVLVRETLQQYRAAYDGLDVASTQAVWPAVDSRALARAFDGLESQRLTFSSCDVSLAAAAATATCRGTARYVAKFGSREPRVEPRVWRFTLRKSGTAWTIETARAVR